MFRDLNLNDERANRGDVIPLSNVDYKISYG